MPDQLNTLRPETIPRRARSFVADRAMAGLMTAGLVSCLAAAGCGNATGNVVLGALGATAVGAYSPAEEIEQVYYLGIFDPHEQVQPQQVYRVTVHGQASAISQMKFGSGWVPASVVDALSTRAGFADNSDQASFSAGDKDSTVKLKTGRRLILFGPEGFREAPADYRLVIVMGASPQAFFSAIDQSLGVISQVRRENSNPEVVKQLLIARQQLTTEQTRLNDLSQDVNADTTDSSSKGSKS